MDYVVISGAVILGPSGSDGSGVRFRQKCDACGLIQGNSGSSSASNVTGHFNCDKCKKSNDILIKKM